MSQDLINPSWNADAARDMQSLTGFGDKNTAYKVPTYDRRHLYTGTRLSAGRGALRYRRGSTRMISFLARAHVRNLESLGHVIIPILGIDNRARRPSTMSASLHTTCCKVSQVLTTIPCNGQRVICFRTNSLPGIS